MRSNVETMIKWALALMLLLLQGCGGGGGGGTVPDVSSSADVPAASSGAAVPGRHLDDGANHGQGRPRHYELQAYLQAEFARLGIDPDKAVATAPQGANNAVFDLTLAVVDPDGEGGDPPTGIELSWTERCLGDYDQNGEVGVSDLTPLGAHFYENVTYDDAALHGGIADWPAGDPDDAGKNGSAAILAASSVGADPLLSKIIF